MEVVFVVQSYAVGRSRRIEPDLPREADSAEEAVEIAKRLMETKIGVVAYVRILDPKVDAWDEARVLYREGDMTPEDAATLRLVS